MKVSNKQKSLILAAVMTAVTGSVFAVDTTVGTGNGIAYGTASEAAGEKSIAIGNNASASEAESLAIGTAASATSSRALAVGSNAKATGARAVAVGSGAGSSGALGFASGINSSRSVTYTHKTINYATTAEGDNAVALGYYANAKYTGVAVGQNALAATGGVAIGKGVFEDTGNDLAGGVAIGQDSASTGVYSLAMGRNAFASGSTSMAMGYEATANGNFAVAMGRNVSATGTSTAIGRNATATNGGLSIGSQDNDASTDKTTASAKGAVAIGKNTTASAKDTVAIGTNATANITNSVSIGSDAKTTTVIGTPSIAINGETRTFAGTSPVGTVSVGDTGKERTITNVAAGRIDETSTDAVNGSQLNAVINSLNFTTVVDGDNTTVTESTNINGGKEFKVDVNKNLVNMNSANFGGNNSVRSIITKEKAQFFDDSVSTNTKVSATGLTIENTDSLDSATYNTTGVTADSNGRHVAFTTDGIDAGNQVISNVADGVKDTDVATVGQLKANVSTESVITDNQVDNIAAVRVTNGKSTGDANAQYGVYVSRTTVDSIAKASNRFAGDDVIKVERWSAPSNVADLTTFKYDGTAAATKTPLTYKANGTTETVMLSDGLDFTNGNNTTASVDANGVVKYDLNKDITVDKANIGGIVIDNRGINAADKTITNVARGTVANDAVNVSQLDEVRNAMNNGDTNTLNRANAYTDSRVSETTAQNAALAALHPLDFNKNDKFQIATGVGNYKNKTSVALGAFYQPNENILLSVGTTLGSHRNVVNAGATFRFGKRSEMNTNRHDALEAKVKTLEETLADISAKYDELVKKVENK